MMLSRTGWDRTPLSVAGQTNEGRRAPWGCAAGAPYRGTASPPPLLLLLCVCVCACVEQELATPDPMDMSVANSSLQPIPIVKPEMPS